MGRVGALGAAALLVLALTPAQAARRHRPSSRPTAAPTAGAVQSAAPVSPRGRRPTSATAARREPRRADGSTPRGHRHPPRRGRKAGRAARTARADRRCRRHRPFRHPPGRARTSDPGAPRAGTDPGASARKHQRRRRKAGGARLRPGGQLPGVEHVHVASVLVHDLQFSVAPPIRRPWRLPSPRKASSRTRSGTMARRWMAEPWRSRYTGPLLSDALVESVRNGMARGAGVQPADVTLAPRSTTGEGVDMSREPEPAPEPEPEPSAEDSGTHSHEEAGDDSGSGTPATTPGADDSGH